MRRAWTCFSHAALFGLDDARFLSTAGTLNPHQPALLRSAMGKLPAGGRVVAAVDHDDGGDAIAEQIEAVFTALSRPDITLQRHSPEAAGADWNDVARAYESPAGDTPTGPGPA